MSTEQSLNLSFDKSDQAEYNYQKTNFYWNKEKASHDFGKWFVLFAMFGLIVIWSITAYNQTLGDDLSNQWHSYLLPLITLVFGYIFGKGR